MRELLWAVESRRSHDWDHTCELLANACNLAARKHITTASELHPYRRRDTTSRLLTLGDLADFTDL